MKLTLQKRTIDCLTESFNHSNIRSIKEVLGSQNKIESNLIGFFGSANSNLLTFFKSFIGPGDEVLTAGPTNNDILREITACDASYCEFYEKPIFLPDLLGLIGAITTRTKLIILGNANRYTGVVYSQREIEHILNISGNIIVALDESAYETSKISFLDLIDKYDNLVLLRTFEHEEKKIDYIISNPAVINKINQDGGGLDFSSPDLYKILNSLKNKGNRLARIKDARQEMLYLSIRLRMYDVNCFLNPDYSFVIKTSRSMELLSQLNDLGVQARDLACFPGLAGHILLPFDLDIDALSIIDIFETISNAKNDMAPEYNRLTAYLPSGVKNSAIIAGNYKNVRENSLESNMVF